MNSEMWTETRRSKCFLFVGIILSSFGAKGFYICSMLIR
uniref:Uncharacterized protein n=1 Tax=Arundo donax TaxID=35708 RepID=A0A0A8Y7A2_ARUDO